MPNIDELSNLPEATRLYLIEQRVGVLERTLENGLASLLSEIKAVGTQIGVMSTTLAGHNITSADMDRRVTKTEGKIEALEATVTNVRITMAEKLGMTFGGGIIAVILVKAIEWIVVTGAHHP